MFRNGIRLCKHCFRSELEVPFDLINFTKQRPRVRSLCRECFRYYNVSRGANRRAREYGRPGVLGIELVRYVFMRDKRCLACHTDRRLTLDHIHPLATGGANSVDNLQVLCAECNTTKGTHTRDYRVPARRYSLAERTSTKDYYRHWTSSPLLLRRLEPLTPETILSIRTALKEVSNVGRFL